MVALSVRLLLPPATRPAQSAALQPERRLRLVSHWPQRARSRRLEELRSSSRGQLHSSSVLFGRQPRLLYRKSGTVSTTAEMQTLNAKEQKASEVPLQVTHGTPSPLGVSLTETQAVINFAIFSQHATAVKLCLYLDGRLAGPPSEEIELDAEKNKTGNVWHVAVHGVPLRGVVYGYKIDGPQGWEAGHRYNGKQVLLDPYAKLVEGRRMFGDASNKFEPSLGTYDLESEEFDWGENYSKPEIPEKDLFIYEMAVRAFTADESSGLKPEIRGSFLAVIDKIPHLLELGINAVELLPIFEYDEFEFQRRPNPRDHLINTWGYSTINFFAPMSRFASAGGGPGAASMELKQMVKALHAAGIEVILDIVYNHTNESDDAYPYMTSFRGIDNLVYYMVDTNSYVQLLNFSGCGNTFNCNHPVVLDLVLDSLRHWVTEYHVDGFRFDLASCLCRDQNGIPIPAPPVIKAIAKDAILSQVKLIVEPWDCGGLYQVGKFPNWDRWAEWNGIFRDDIRRFIKGDPGMKSAFATRVAGSADLYNVNQRRPYHSINFVIAHDGFTLMDLVTYNSKHNEANGESGNDGSNDNFSWNCGVEGPTEDSLVEGLRARQVKNYHIALIISQGTPMMLMGDEYGHSRKGNNNSYGHDNELNHFQWKQLEERRRSTFDFFAKANCFRRQHPLLGREMFLKNSDVTWHEDNWGNAESRFLAFTLHDQGLGGGDLYIAFNAHTYSVDSSIPAPPTGKSWFRIVDTNLPSPDDFIAEGVAGIGSRYYMAPFSCVLLSAR
eukprot:SM000102S09215  [mRNA]  locus=s102:296863:303330:+ [translate_table: standard]